MVSRKLVWFITLGIVIAIAGYHHLSKKAPRMTHAVPAGLILSNRDIAHASYQDVAQSIIISGNLYPLTQTTIIAKVSGDVSTVLVRAGQAVTKGQLLIKLDTADLAQSLLEQQANFAAKKAAYDLAKSNVIRYKQLYLKKYYSKSDYENLTNKLHVSDANMQQAKASVDEAKLQLQYATINSPISGIVSQRNIDPGMNANAGMQLLKIVNLSELELQAIVPANQINQVHLGQMANFQVAGIKSTFHGKVVRINPSNINGTQSYYVYIDVANQQHLLRDGMFVDGSIVTQSSTHALTIPFSALKQEKGKDYVYAISGQKIIKQRITVGLSLPQQNMLTVTKGLKQNQMVIVSNISVSPGENVNINTIG